MTAVRWVTIWCDGKDRTQQGTFDCGQHVDGDTAAQIRRDKADHGWLHGLPGGRDLCPRHAGQRDDSSKWGES